LYCWAIWSSSERLTSNSHQFGTAYFIHGNHDTDTEQAWANLMNSELADRCIDGRVVVLPDGTRLAGLGGVFREKVWAPPLLPAHASYDAWLESLQSGWQKRESM